MTYLVLARKYRPKTFAQMVGQPHVVQALSNALHAGRLHHAYLFTGTRGVGKTTVSRILAKSLNCVGVDGAGGVTAHPCGVCAACSAIEAGCFADYTELDAASNRGVEEVQQLLEQALYKPVLGRYKVFMIDEVHMLSNTAFNAMLKTLEEPPEYLKFVLATTDPQKVPVTVLSRCLMFNLRPMAPETVAEHLAQVLHSESITVEPPALRLLAQAARGSMRDALSLTDQAIAFGAGQIRQQQVMQMLGSVDEQHALTLIAALAQADGAEVVVQTRALQEAGLSAGSTLEQMCDALHRMMVAKVARQTDAALYALAQSMPDDEIHLLYSMCLHGREDLGVAVDEYAALTMVLLRFLAFKPAVPAVPAVEGGAVDAEKKSSARSAVHSQDAVDACGAPEDEDTAREESAGSAKEGAGGAQRPAGRQAEVSLVHLPVLQSSAPSASTPMPQRHLAAAPQSDLEQFATTGLGREWLDIVQALIDKGAITALVRELALQSQLCAQTPQCWSLQCDSEVLINSASIEKIQVALANLGHAVTLVVTLGATADTPARRLQHAARVRHRKAQRLIMTDPLVEQLVREFGATVVADSIEPILTTDHQSVF